MSYLLSYRIKPYIPYYNLVLCKLLRYEIRPFDDNAGHTADLRIAIFLDKKGNEKEAIAQVMWK
jgi:hypothetical protein